MKTRPRVPRATYRLQFHRGFTLRHAIVLLPYLDALGVSHIYASPLLKARPGSTHGYDVCDPTRLNPELGTEADLDELAAALRERGMGLILDIVPNHMAVGGPDNPWWWDVLRLGQASPFANSFDIDWDPPCAALRGKVLMPVLGDELDRALDRGELQVVCEKAEVTVRYFDQQFPVHPESILVPGKFLEEAIADFDSNPESLRRFLEQQPYRLAFWRHGDLHLNYRRFFTVTHLAGLRVELPQVFADTHNRILDWHQRGLLDGVRVDHPDGLRDPQDYLHRLARAAPGAWIVVEKILQPGETLPTDWPVAGTTGYDFLNRAGGLFIDPAADEPLTRFYSEFTGEPTDYTAIMRDKKRHVLRRHLVAEVSRLTHLLAAILPRYSPGLEIGPDELRDGLVEIIACFPVYRAYCRAEASICSENDRAAASEAVTQARRANSHLSPTALGFLDDLLQRRVQDPLAAEFVMRFQQLTGPAMAKGGEDTAFYCYNRFAALNEVGGDPSRFGSSVDDFHRACEQARRHWPAAMLTTSTHDTKRGEEVRARLALLSEIPGLWIAAVRAWSALNERHRRDGWPDRNAEYLFYQTVVGAWPLPLDRAIAYMEKAAREAKQHTDWSEPNRPYEEALKAFVAGALADPAFISSVEGFVSRIARAGFVNSLGQTLLKLTAPGVPDLYQGTDLWDFSLVDPDNRRPVDFDLRQTLMATVQAGIAPGPTPGFLDELLGNPGDGRVKLFLIRQVLHYRRLHPELFQQGRYVPISVSGQCAHHVCAFARLHHRKRAIVVVPRLVVRLNRGLNIWPIGEDVWGDTRLVLAGTRQGHGFANVLTGESHRAQSEKQQPGLRLGEILGRFPVALLEDLSPHVPRPSKEPNQG